MTEMRQFKITGPYVSDTQTVFVPPTGGVSRLMMIEDENGNQLGVNFKDDGTFEVGAWDGQGEWVTLSLVTWDGFSHATVFDLDQYTKAAEDSGGYIPIRKPPRTNDTIIP